MVQTKTFIIMIMCYFITIIATERYLKERPAEVSLVKVVLYAIASITLLALLTLLIPNFFLMLIYGSVIIATFVCIYSRHRLAYKKGKQCI